MSLPEPAVERPLASPPSPVLSSAPVSNRSPPRPSVDGTLAPCSQPPKTASIAPRKAFPSPRSLTAALRQDFHDLFPGFLCHCQIRFPQDGPHFSWGLSSPIQFKMGRRIVAQPLTDSGAPFRCWNQCAVTPRSGQMV